MLSNRAVARPVGCETDDLTALDRYVAAPDPSYKYELAGTIDGEGYTGYVLDMTSQSWRSAAEVDRTLWRHWVTVIKPKNVTSTTIAIRCFTGALLKSAPL